MSNRAISKVSKQAEGPAGWVVWQQYFFGSGYRAVPAPDGTCLPDVLFWAHRIGPYQTIGELAAECGRRYGWHDTCESCMELANMCRHLGQIKHSLTN